MKHLVIFFSLILSVRGNEETMKNFNKILPAQLVGGKKGNIKDMPYLVSIRIDEHYAPDCNEMYFCHICGGSLISLSTILTAAQCFEVQDNPNAFYVYMGASKLSEATHNTLIRFFKQIFIHEDFKKDILTKDDLAIIVLREPVPKNHVTIAPIAIVTETPKAGTICTIAGWGNALEKTKREDNLKIATKLIGTPKICEDNFNISYSGSMCGINTADKIALCDGDSGGPLVYNNKVAGIAVMGKMCNQSKYMEVFTNVAYYNSWIVKNGYAEGWISGSSRQFLISYSIFLISIIIILMN